MEITQQFIDSIDNIITEYEQLKISKETFINGKHIEFVKNDIKQSLKIFKHNLNLEGCDCNSYLLVKIWLEKQKIKLKR